MDQYQDTLYQDIRDSSREVLVDVMCDLVNRADDEQLKYIRRAIYDCRSISSITRGRKRPRRSSSLSDFPPSSSILHMSNDVLSVKLFPFLAISDHFRMAQTCHRMFVLSGCMPPSRFYMHKCAWNKHVQIPIRVSDSSLAKLCQFAHTPSMSMGGCYNVTDAGLTHLRNLPLHTLDLRHCERVTDAGLVVLQHLPLLTLDLSGLHNITERGLAHLRKLRIHTLYLKSCWGITDRGLARCQQLPLEQLELDGCHRISDTGLSHLQGMSIHTLMLSNCDNITDEGLIHLRQLPLHILDLEKCYKITDVGLFHLQTLPINSLSLNYCTKITDVGFVHLRHLPLNTLSLVGCQDITNVGLNNFQYMPNRIRPSISRIVKPNGWLYLPCVRFTNWCSETELGSDFRTEVSLKTPHSSTVCTPTLMDSTQAYMVSGML